MHQGHARRVASRRQQVPKSRPGPVLPHFSRQGPSRSRPTGRLTPLTCRPGVRVGATCSVRDQSAPAGGGDQSQTPREARNYSNPRRQDNGLGQPAAAEGAQAANRRSERAGQPVRGRGLGAYIPLPGAWALSVAPARQGGSWGVPASEFW